MNHDKIIEYVNDLIEQLHFERECLGGSNMQVYSFKQQILSMIELHNLNPDKLTWYMKKHRDYVLR